MHTQRRASFQMEQSDVQRVAVQFVLQLVVRPVTWPPLGAGPDTHTRLYIIATVVLFVCSLANN